MHRKKCKFVMLPRNIYITKLMKSALQYICNLFQQFRIKLIHVTIQANTLWLVYLLFMFFPTEYFLDSLLTNCILNRRRV